MCRRQQVQLRRCQSAGAWFRTCNKLHVMFQLDPHDILCATDVTVSLSCLVSPKICWYVPNATPSSHAPAFGWMRCMVARSPGKTTTASSGVVELPPHFPQSEHRTDLDLGKRLARAVGRERPVTPVNLVRVRDDGDEADPNQS